MTLFISEARSCIFVEKFDENMTFSENIHLFWGYIESGLKIKIATHIKNSLR